MDADDENFQLILETWFPSHHIARWVRDLTRSASAHAGGRSGVRGCWGGNEVELARVPVYMADLR